MMYKKTKIFSLHHYTILYVFPIVLVVGGLVGINWNWPRISSSVSVPVNRTRLVSLVRGTVACAIFQLSAVERGREEGFIIM